MKYRCWKSSTCFVCRGITGREPTVHAVLADKPHKMVSPCDTVDTIVEADNRREAIKKYKELFAQRVVVFSVS